MFDIKLKVETAMQSETQGNLQTLAPEQLWSPGDELSPREKSMRNQFFSFLRRWLHQRGARFYHRQAPLIRALVYFHYPPIPPPLSKLLPYGLL